MNAIYFHFNNFILLCDNNTLYCVRLVMKIMIEFVINGLFLLISKIIATHTDRSERNSFFACQNWVICIRQYICHFCFLLTNLLIFR